MVLIVIKGPSSTGIDIVGNVVHQYTEETSAFVIPPTATSQPTDIKSLMGNNVTTILEDQGGSQDNTANAIQVGTYAIQDTDNAIQAVDSVSTDYLDIFKPDQIIKYTVQDGDNIGSIALYFGVSIDTIIWANNLRNPDVLALGEVLKIPPVTGVIHTIKNKDTIASIAKKYKAEPSKILSFNNLTDGQLLKANEEIIVPGGKMSGPQPSVKLTNKTSGNHGIYVSVGDGQCVPFVQAHGFSKLHGNAYQWAKYINTKVPTQGGVVVLKGGRYGHVALITAVKEDSIQVVEQNYYGPYIIDHREISLSDRTIVGFLQ